MKTWTFVLVAILFPILTVNAVQALPFAGETFTDTGITGTSSKLFDASFTLGAQVPLTSLWTVSSFSATPVGCSANCTASWNLTGLLFNANNGTLTGVATSPTYTAGGDLRMLTLTFGGSSSSNSYLNTDLTNFLKTTSGAFSDSTRAVPEPATILLLAFGFLGLAGWRWLGQAQRVPS